MIELKPFIDTGDNIKPAKTIKPHEEMMVFRRDITTLFQYLQIPGNDHACEHERLIECVSRLSKDFGIDPDDYVPDNSIVEQVEIYDNYEACVERAWNG